MKTLQFLIDNVCADFTVDSLLGLARKCVAESPCTVSDIARAIIRKDRSLDARCAEGLAEGVLMVLSDSGEVEIRQSRVYVTGLIVPPQ